MTKKKHLTEHPKDNANGLFGFPINLDLDNISADIAILGVPYGLPYQPNYFANDQSKTPDLMRKNASLMETTWEDARTREHFDWDLGGPLLNKQEVRGVEMTNVMAVWSSTLRARNWKLCFQAVADKESYACLLLWMTPCTFL